MPKRVSISLIRNRKNVQRDTDSEVMFGLKLPQQTIHNFPHIIIKRERFSPVYGDSLRRFDTNKGSFHRFSGVLVWRLDNICRLLLSLHPKLHKDQTPKSKKIKLKLYVSHQNKLIFSRIKEFLKLSMT